MIAVLREASGPMKLSSIHQAVATTLGGSASPHSVNDYLRRHLDGSEALFERTKPGHYRIRSR